MLLCLEKSPDPEALGVILQTITDFVKSGEATIEDRLEDILVRVLDLTTFRPSMVRAFQRSLIILYIQLKIRWCECTPSAAFIK